MTIPKAPVFRVVMSDSEPELLQRWASDLSDWVGELADSLAVPASADCKFCDSIQRHLTAALAEKAVLYSQLCRSDYQLKQLKDMLRNGLIIPQEWLQ